MNAGTNRLVVYTRRFRNIINTYFCVCVCVCVCARVYVNLIVLHHNARGKGKIV